ncbi:MAG TPA: hypothetical protein EYG31_10025 [Porticoccaceae bacterium]|nr:hypothetical protein [Gammaproteobacteria bacterium]HIL60962.1 hypothetical protein [Porticoccaceae bacterium]
MKIVYKLIIAFIAISIFYVSLNFAASELGGEVVQLIRNDSEGSTKNIRVWIVDARNQAWIEHGDINSYWINRLSSEPKVSLIRGGVEIKYTAVTDIDSHEIYHDLRREKYGIADRIIELLSFGAAHRNNCTGIPVRLDPV